MGQSNSTKHFPPNVDSENRSKIQKPFYDALHCKEVWCRHKSPTTKYEPAEADASVVPQRTEPQDEPQEQWKLG